MLPYTMTALLLPLAAASPAAAAAPAASVRCATVRTGRCPTPSAPRSAYAHSSGLLTAAECCAQCAADGSLCFGWIWSAASGPDDTAKPAGGSCSQYDAPLDIDQLQSQHNCSFGLNQDDSPKPMPLPPKKPPANAKNVLFLVADDMRPSINPYAIEGEEPRFTTPALDELARTGTLFTRAYIQISYCAPSRNSFMSGRRPDSTNIYSFIGTFRDPASGQHWVALPEHFVQNGYNVGGSGKLFHPGVPANYDQPWSWTVPYQELGDNATNLCQDYCCGVNDRNSTGGPGQEGNGHYCAYDLAPGTYLSDQRDTFVAQDNLRTMGAAYKSAGTPFFVGLGFHKPHLPWHFPKKYWDSTPANPPVAKHQAFPADVPAIGWHECAECSSWSNPNNTAERGRIAYFNTKGEGMPLPNQQWQSNMRRAYYSAISYVDGLIGDMLSELTALGLDDSTIVTFTGDHGWSTGEHNVWCKMTNSEAGTRVPLFVRAPWIPKSVGLKSTALAELVDLYPTISDLAGLTLPTGVGGARLGGVSLAPIMRDPQVEWPKVAMSQFPRCWQNNSGFDMNQILGPGDEVNKTNSITSMSDCHWVRPSALDFMGYSMRTDSHRLVQWMVWDGKQLQPVWDRIVGLELYDHSSNSQLDNSYLDATENQNLAHSSHHASLLAKMQVQLRREVEKWLHH